MCSHFNKGRCKLNYKLNKHKIGEIPCGIVGSGHHASIYVTDWPSPWYFEAAGGTVCPLQVILVDSFQPSIATDCMLVQDLSNGFSNDYVVSMASTKRFSAWRNIYVRCSLCVPLSLKHLYQLIL